MSLHDTIERKLTKARTQLLLSQPFFGTMCVRLKTLPGPVPTMATNGRVILYSPEFVEELTLAELEATIAHEAMHCALGHHCRRGERDPGLWNEAADLAINPILVANGFTLPAGALLDPAFQDLSAEEIYARWLRNNSSSDSPQSSGQQSGQAGGSGGLPQQPSSAPPSDSASQTNDATCTGALMRPRGSLRGTVPSRRDRVVSVKCWMLPRMMAVPPRRRRRPASRRSGVLRQSWLSAPQLPAAMSQPVLNDLCGRAASPGRTGARS
jgi:hypothetical protein